MSGTLKAKGIGWTGRRSAKFREIFLWLPFLQLLLIQCFAFSLTINKYLLYLSVYLFIY